MKTSKRYIYFTMGKGFKRHKRY